PQLRSNEARLRAIGVGQRHVATAAVMDGVEQLCSISREGVAESILPLLAQLVALREVDNAGAIGTTSIDLGTAGCIRLEVDPLAIRAEGRIVGVLSEGDDLFQ